MKDLFWYRFVIHEFYTGSRVDAMCYIIATMGAKGLAKALI